MNTPLVSITTIFLNAEKFLAEAIESVLCQTYSHWELLLVDDGSSDNSTIIAQRYAAQYPQQICYLEHPNHQNRGKSSSRNLGIQQARGEYLTFLDADDVFLPHKLERQVAILEAQPAAGMVYGRTEYWYRWAGNPAGYKRDFLSRLGVPPYTMFHSPTLVIRFLKDGGTVPCLCAILARRSLVARVGAFDERIQYMYEDQVFLVKLCLAAPVYVEDGCSERYRQHAESSSAVAIGRGEYHPLWPNCSRHAFLKWLAAYGQEQGIKDASLWDVLQQELWFYRHPRLHRLVNPLKVAALYLRASGELVMERLYQDDQLG
jgi:glycosyltransferase involved in cell wall biosynthesis